VLGQMLQDDIAELIAARDFDALKMALDELPIADVAEVVTDLPPDDAAVMFRLLPRETAAEVFSYLPPEGQEKLLSRVSAEALEHIVNEMAADDRTRLLEELPGEVTHRLLAMLKPDELRVARRLLGYPEDSIGRLMTPEYVTIKPEWTVPEVLSHLRKVAADKETINVLYVVDDKGRLTGEVRLAQLVLADPAAKVSDLAETEYAALSAFEDREHAVQTFRKYDRPALPVTDSGGVLLGMVTVDDVLDVAQEEAAEDIQKFAGHGALDEPYFETGFFALVRKRGTWLVMLFFGELLTSNALQHYEHAFETVAALVLFIPLIISSGGNSGGQSASLILRGLATREIVPGDWWRVAVREMGIGLSLGILLAVVGFCRVWFIPPDDAGDRVGQIAMTIGLAVVGIVTIGAVIGSLLPLLFQKLGADPAVTSSPFIATLVDVTGIIIYFQVAQWILGV